MNYTPRCVVCGKVVTWQFKVCAECEAKYGNRVDNRPEWLTFLINEEERLRYHLSNHLHHYIEDSDDGFCYDMDLDGLVEARINYAGLLIDDSDGNIIEIQDSDWEAVYSWSL